ncbi:MAG: CaiB/BaiF CoA transferase family protein [Gemmatimonas sp.]|jgi:crotonobetainyl-CoA:carnitine CoA-transferase CaiB-like acyl-CoA transferase|uniref:CaiB/BaiF CoA transferase family protein n=1 Tax=Gemmatimonas sp. TaxID=1962908 RepID=UPI00391F7337|nr:CoA transferase [Gemmatimonadota bacterium]
MKSLPLTGVKVLDLSRVLAGPLCSMMLGDLGASVIKVERPGAGDDTRGWGPPFAPDGQSAYFLSCNRNKLSLAADFRDDTDRTLLLELLSEADVVLENFLPGVLSRYGLDPGALLAQFPQIIWCTVSGFGPDSERPGYDFVVQAESGWMAMTGEPDGDPMKVGVAMVDVTTGKDAAIGILAALTARERARPQRLPPADRRVHVTLASSAVAALVNVAQNTLVSGRPARRWGNAHANLVPYQLFRAADRPMVLAVGNDAQWVAAMRALGLPDLADDEALRTNAGRLAQRDRIVSRLSAHMRTADSIEWIRRLDAAGVPCGLVREVHEALEPVTASARTGMPPLWNGRVRLEPPGLGQHTVTIREKRWRIFDELPIPE